MNLKSLMKYDVFLQGKISELSGIIMAHSTSTSVTHEYVKKDHVTLVNDSVKPFEFTADNLIMFYLNLTNERKSVAHNININKKNIDTLIANNIINRNMLAFFLNLNNLRQKREFETTGVEHATNINGDPVQLRYPIKSVITPSFDNSMVRSINAELLTTTDSISDAIDLLKLSEIDFTPTYNVNMYLENMYEMFLNSK